MSIIVRKDGNEVLLLKPAEFRRVYTLRCTEGGDSHVEYSHTDVVVELENGHRAMLEIIQGLLPNGSVIIKMMPTEATFGFELSTKGTKGMAYLKKLIFMTFPDLTTKDVYLNEDLEQRGS